MAKLAPQEITPLEAYDPVTQERLGIAGYPEFDDFVTMNAENTARIWKALASLNAYSAGLENPAWPAVGRLTPGRKEGLEPFMFAPSEGLATPDTPTLTDAHIALRGLYKYMSHPKIIVYGFGPKSRSTVHQFLNHRIEERKS